MSVHFKLLEPAFKRRTSTHPPIERFAWTPSHVVAFGGSDCAARSSRLVPLLARIPTPFDERRHVFPVLFDVLLVLDQSVSYPLPEVRCTRPELRQPVDHVLREVESVEIVQHDHVERRRGRALLLVATHVKAL